MINNLEPQTWFTDYQNTVRNIRKGNKVSQCDFDYKMYMRQVTSYDSSYGRHLRYGQCLFNVLYVEYQDIANFVQGSDIDPFAFDKGDVVDNFLKYLKGLSKENAK